MSLVGALGYSTNEYTIPLKGGKEYDCAIWGENWGRGGEGGRNEPYD